MRERIRFNLVSRTFTLARGLPAPPPSQGKGPGNEVGSGFISESKQRTQSQLQDTAHICLITYLFEVEGLL